jgi:hypothetical protein
MRASEMYRAIIIRPWRDWGIGDESLPVFLDGVKSRLDTRRSGRVSSFFVVQGRRETEARIGCGCDLGPSFPALPLIQDDGL